MGKASPYSADQLALIDGLVRQGNLEDARQALHRLAKTKTPRPFAAQTASLARRANLPLLAINLLNPIVSAAREKGREISSAEEVEYAAALIRIGGVEEADSILAKLESSKISDVPLYRAFARVTQWNYEESIPYLRRFLALPSTDSYQTLVAKINLAAAYVYERQPKVASGLIEEVLAVTDKPDSSLLYSNALQLAAQNALAQKDWNEAKHYLKLAEEKLKDSGGLVSLFLQKFQLALQLFKNGPNGDLLHQLENLRKDALNQEHWETVRDCDRIRALSELSEALFLRLYFGTPFEAFRKWLVRDFGRLIKVPVNYLWAVAPSEPRFLIELENATLNGKETSLEPGSQVHRLLCILSSDFYRPFRLASLHHQLYSKEFYHPRTSPLRIHQLIHRLRKWSKTYRAPLAAIEDKGLYRVELQPSLAILVGPPSLALEAPLDRRLGQIRRHWKDGEFSAQEAARLLGVSARTALRLLTKGQETGAIVRAESGMNARYRFSKTKVA